MAFITADRVRETTTTTGTGTVTLLGAVAGYQGLSKIGNGNTCPYAIVHQTLAQWEVGVGTYTSSGTTLARTTVLDSSNSGSAVNFSAGTKDVFVTLPGAAIDTDGTLAAHSDARLATQKAIKTYVDAHAGSSAWSSITGTPTTLAGYGITDAQGLDATLTALAGANWAANSVPIGSGADALSQVNFAANTFPARASSGNLVSKTITDFGLSLVDDADAATARTTLGLGTLATQSGTFSGTSSGTNTGDQTTITGNAGTATALQTGRTINGVTFDGTANITVTAAGSTLSDTVTVAKGGTGDTSLTAYAVLCGGTTSTGAVQSLASVGTTGQALLSNGAGALPSFQTLPGGGDALTTNPLSQFAATTSAQLAGVISDENGSGKLIFAAGTLAIASGKTATFSNTLTFTGTDSSSVAFGSGGTVLYSGGDLGTPSAGTLTNCTFPTLNQNTTGSAATLTTTRTIGGSNFNGSANVTSFPVPGAIGGTTPAAITGTTITATTSVTTVDDAYDATTWNGNNTVPTKNAVRDKIESLGGGSISGLTTGTIPQAASSTTIANGFIVNTDGTYPTYAITAPVDGSKYFYGELGITGLNGAATPTTAPTYAIAAQGTYSNGGTLTDGAFYILDKITSRTLLEVDQGTDAFLFHAAFDITSGPIQTAMASKYMRFHPDGNLNQGFVQVDLATVPGSVPSSTENVQTGLIVAGHCDSSSFYFNPDIRLGPYNPNASTPVAATYSIGSEGTYNNSNVFGGVGLYLYDYRNNRAVFTTGYGGDSSFIFDNSVVVQANAGFVTSGNYVGPYHIGGFGATTALNLQSTYNASATTDAINFIVGTSGTPLYPLIIADNTQHPTSTFAYQTIINAANSVASGTSATLDEFKVAAATTTLTGTTHVTTAKGFNKVSFYKPTYTDSSSVTVDQGATLYIEDAPAAAGSVTLTNAYALWVDNGTTRLDGNIITTGLTGILVGNGSSNASVITPGTGVAAELARGSSHTTSSGTPTINTDAVDYFELTAQAADITSFTSNLSGTPAYGQKLWVSITGTGSHSITWGSSFESGAVATLPTTLTTTRQDIGFIWNVANTKWRCVAVA
jgi:hypothetical protein